MATEPGRAVSAASAEPSVPPLVVCTRRGVKAIQLVFLAVFALLLVAAVSSGEGLWWADILGGLGILVLIALMWRIGRLAILVRPKGIEVKNFTNTHRLGWDEIEEFAESGYSSRGRADARLQRRGEPKLFVLLTDGTAVSVTLYSDSFSHLSGKARRAAMAQLNDLLARHRAEGAA
jgi:hypothetical protein